MKDAIHQEIGEHLMEKLARDALITAYDKLDAIESMVREGVIRELREKAKQYPEVGQHINRHVRAYWGLKVEDLAEDPLTS